MAAKKKKKTNQISIAIIFFITVLASIIIIGIAAFIAIDLYLFKPQEKQKPKQTGWINTPDSFNSTTVLFCIENKKALESLMLVRISPEYKEVLCVPVSVNTLAKVSVENKTLGSYYKSEGINGVKKGIKSTFDIEVQRYVILDNKSFEKLVEKMGGLYYSVPSNMYYEDPQTSEVTNYKPSDIKRLYFGKDILKIINYPLYKDGEADKLKVSGSIIASLINQYSNNKGQIREGISESAQWIMDNTITDITLNDVEAGKESFIYLIEQSQSPATYNIPKGKFDKDGFFVVDSEYSKEINNYFYLAER